MKVHNLVGSVGLEKKKVAEKQNASQDQTIQTVNSNKPLSFMSIPSMAFMGKLVVPNLPRGAKALPNAVITKETGLKQYDNDPTLEYKVYPQDPLVSKPDIYKMKGEVTVGPENKRIKTVDSSPLATPDAKGNYICDIESPQFDRVNSFVFANKTLQLYENALGRKIDWAFPNETIKIHPRAGVTANAYYSRWDEEIKLFYFQNKFNQSERCYTSKMADVVTHESGHAVLDGLRPSYIGWGSAGGAVHEGFGDATAMLIAMHDDKLLDTVIEKTGGNLKKENYIASLAEQFGKAVYGNKMYLRNAINNLKGSDFESGKESKEVHNYGRLFGAFFYDVLVEMAIGHGLEQNPKEALIKTRDDLTNLFARAMGDFSPPGNVYFDDIAKAMLQADKTMFDGKYKNMLTKVFQAREIINPADIKQWEQKQAKLPEVFLPPTTLNSEDAIIAFVEGNKEKLGLPKDKQYQVETAYNNSFGETFIHLRSPKALQFKYDGQKYTIEVYDGLSLGFDRDGKLFYAGENKTTRDEVNDAYADAKKQLGLVKALQDKGLPVTNPGVYRLPGSKSNTLIKVPKIEDPVSK